VLPARQKGLASIVGAVLWQLDLEYGLHISTADVAIEMFFSSF
jgi:hypothetical protein